MSKIALVVQNVPVAVRTDAITRIRKMTGRPVSDIAQSLDCGDPVCVARLFENDHDDVAARLRNLVSALTGIGIRVRLFELSPDEKFDGKSQDKAEISPDVPINLLDAHQEQLRHQQDMWDRYGHT